MSKELVMGDKNSLLSPGNFEHYYRIASMMSKSDMVPKSYKEKPQDVLIAMEMGVSLGMGPLQAIQNIAVINGKPCLYGDGMLAVCSGRGDFENIKEDAILDKDGKVIGYKCMVKRKGRDPVIRSFDIPQAQAAGLWGKVGPWKQYPERMLQMRARGFALRDSFADALGGVRMAEEVQDYEIKDITPAKDSSDIDALLANKEKPNVNKVMNKVNREPIGQVDTDTGEIYENEDAPKTYEEAKGK